MSDEAIGAEAPQPDLAPELAVPEGIPEQAEVSSEPVIPDTFTVKVGGEEQQVTLQQALDGWMRQEDYTRKTQAVAAEREQLSHADQLWQAIEQDPQATIQKIAEAYGYKLSPAQEAAAARGDDPFALDEDQPDQASPVETEMRQFMDQARLERVQADITRELTDVHAKYGVNFDDDQLLQYAFDHRIPDLEDAFRAFAFEGMTRAAADKQVQAAKAAQPPIAGGHGVASGVMSPGTGSKFPTIAESFAAAEAALSG